MDAGAELIVQAKADIPAKYMITTVLWEPYMNATCGQFEHSFMKHTKYTYATRVDDTSGQPINDGSTGSPKYRVGEAFVHQNKPNFYPPQAT
jgi:hypothetical protein